MAVNRMTISLLLTILGLILPVQLLTPSPTTTPVGVKEVSLKQVPLVTSDLDVGQEEELGGENVELLILYMQRQLEKMKEEQEEDRQRIQELEAKMEKYREESIVEVAESVQLRQHLVKNLEKIQALEKQAQNDRGDIDILLDDQRKNNRDVRRLQDFKDRSAKRFHQLENKVDRLLSSNEETDMRFSKYDQQIQILSDEQLFLRNLTFTIDEIVNETLSNISTCCDTSFAYSLQSNENAASFLSSNQNSGSSSLGNEVSLGLEPGSGDLDDSILSILEEKSNKVELGSGEIQAELESSSSGEIDDSGFHPTGNSRKFDNFIHKDYFTSEILKRDLQLFDMAEKYINLSNYVDKLETRLSSIQLGNFMQSLQESLINFTQNVITLDQWKLASNEIVNSSLQNQDKIFQLRNMIMENSDKIADLHWKVNNAEILGSQQFNILRMFIIRLNNSVEDIKDEIESSKGRRSTLNPRAGFQFYPGQNNVPEGGLETITSRIEDLSLQVIYNQNRLGNLEVKVINETLFDCKKYTVDNYQDIRLAEHHDRIATNTESVLLLNELIKEVDGNIREVVSLYGNSTRHLKVIRSDQRALKGIIPVIVKMQKELDNFKFQLPTDCHEYYTLGHRESGAYVIRPRDALTSIRVWCEMEDSNGWTIIQRRTNGSVNFKQTWNRYKKGFGYPEGEYWLGNEHLHQLTSRHNYSLFIEMIDINNRTYIASYQGFSIASEGNNYSLNISGYHGNCSDALSYSDGAEFSTPDQDHDTSSTHCAFFYEAGWWYHRCQTCNLNGRYNIGITWFNTDTNDWLQLKHVAMKIKRV